MGVKDKRGGESAFFFQLEEEVEDFYSARVSGTKLRLSGLRSTVPI